MLCYCINAEYLLFALCMFDENYAENVTGIDKSRFRPNLISLSYPYPLVFHEMGLGLSIVFFNILLLAFLYVCCICFSQK